MKKLLLGLALAFAATVAVAEAISDVEIEGLKYTLDTETKTATLTGYTVSPTELNVSTITNEGVEYAVTSVEMGAFIACGSLTSVSLPSATTIGESAFSGCGSLTSVSLPSATTIGERAFSNCGSLTSVSLLNVTTVEAGAFNDCDSLTNALLPSAMTIGTEAFYSCGSLASISLPNVTTVKTDAFQYCVSLTNALLPSATTIGESVFFGCGSLTSVSLPSATAIGTEAFSYCELLTSVSLPSATTIGESVFFGCGLLTSVSLPSATAIKNGTFQYCDSLTNVLLPSAMTIGTEAFYGCGSLASISLPNVTTVEADAFEDCFNLSTLFVARAMKATLESDRDFYGIGEDCKIIPLEVEVKPQYAENTTAKVYTNGVEVTSGPILVSLNATVDVVFKADYGYCFEDHSTIWTNTVLATDDPTTVPGPEVVKIPSMLEEETQQAGWKAETAVTVVSTALKSGGTTLDKAEYEYACAFYGITPKTEPTAEDFKAVPKDAQVVQEGEIAVTKESLQAAKAEAVTVANGVVKLAVGVSSNANFTAEAKDWKPVNIMSGDVEVKGGKIVISIPVGGDSGFMILQSGDAKIPPAN